MEKIEFINFYPEDLSDTNDGLRNLSILDKISKLQNNEIIKIYFNKSFSDQIDPKYQRCNSIKEIGYTKYSYKYTIFKKNIFQFNEIDFCNSPKYLEKLNNTKYFEPFGIRVDDEIYGSIRLYNISHYLLDHREVAKLFESIHYDYDLIYTIKKADSKKIYYDLLRLKKQSESSNDIVSSYQNKEINEIILSEFKESKQYYSVDVVLITKSKSYNKLLEKLNHIKELIKPLGDVEIEKLSSPKTILKTYPNTDSNYYFYVSNKEITHLFPFIINGHNEFNEEGLLLHRSNNSIETFNLFSSKHQNYNALICGRSGQGKSVFSNLLFEEMIKNNSHRITIIDVGGSYVETCKKHHGKEFRIDLDQESIIDPFLLYRRHHHKECIINYRAFLYPLFNEKIEKEDLEKYLDEYFNDSKIHKFYDFIEYLKNKINISILDRFSKKGTYSNLFSSDFNINENLNYFNFCNLSQAQDQDVCNIQFLSIITVFKLLSLDQSKRSILICDEVPFFIKDNFNFFKSSISNVRKLGHGIILIFQTLDAITSNKEGNKDYTILDNIEHRFLFNQSDIDLLNPNSNISLQSNSMYRDLAYISSNSSKLFRVKLSESEYFLQNTNKIFRSIYDLISSNIHSLNSFEKEILKKRVSSDV